MIARFPAVYEENRMLRLSVLSLSPMVTHPPTTKIRLASLHLSSSTIFGSLSVDNANQVYEYWE